MTHIIKPRFFNSVLQYNRENIEKINTICAPLKQYFNISYFGYCKMFDNGSYIFLSNSPIYLEAVVCNDYSFNTRYFQNAPKLFSKYEPCKLIWPENTTDELIEKLHAKSICNGFNIYQENSGALDLYFFATDKHSSLVRDFYSTSSYALEKFIVYFQKIAGELINIADPNRRGIFPHLREVYPHIEDIFEATTPWDRKVNEFNKLLDSKVQEEIYEIGKRNSLTPRELQCLIPLSTGKTAKEIARVLNIGPRTVETHIKKIRIKTGCQNKSELVNWFEDRFKNFLGDNINIL